MYASYINMKFKQGMKQAAMEYAHGLRSQMEQIDGANQLLIIDLGGDDALAIAIYDSRSHQEAAAEKAQAVMVGMAEFFAAAPERVGRDVLLNEKL